MHQTQHQRRQTAGHSKCTRCGGRQGGAPAAAAVPAAAPPARQRCGVTHLRRHPAERHRVVLWLLPRGEQLLCGMHRSHLSGNAGRVVACIQPSKLYTVRYSLKDMQISAASRSGSYCTSRRQRPALTSRLTAAVMAVARLRRRRRLPPEFRAAASQVSAVASAAQQLVHITTRSSEKLLTSEQDQSTGHIQRNSGLILFNIGPATYTMVADQPAYRCTDTH